MSGSRHDTQTQASLNESKPNAKLSDNAMWVGGVHMAAMHLESFENYGAAVLQETGGNMTKGILRGPILAANFVSFYEEATIKNDPYAVRTALLKLGFSQCLPYSAVAGASIEVGAVLGPSMENAGKELAREILIQNQGRLELMHQIDRDILDGAAELQMWGRLISVPRKIETWFVDTPTEFINSNLKLDARLPLTFIKPYLIRAHWATLSPIAVRRQPYVDPLQQLFERRAPFCELLTPFAQNQESKEGGKRSSQQSLEIQPNDLRHVMSMAQHHSPPATMSMLSEIKIIGSQNNSLTLPPLHSTYSKVNSQSIFAPNYNNPSIDPARYHRFQFSSPPINTFVEQKNEKGISLWLNNDKGYIQGGVFFKTNSLQGALLAGAILLVADRVNDKLLSEPERAKKHFATALRDLEAAESKNSATLRNWQKPLTDYEKLIGENKSEAIKILDQMQAANRDNPEIFYTFELQRYLILRDYNSNNPTRLLTAENLQQVIVDSNQNKQHLIGKLNLQLTVNDLNTAGETLNKLLQSYPNDYQVHFLAGQYHNQRNDSIATENAFGRAYDLSKEIVRLARLIKEEWTEGENRFPQSKRCLAIAEAEDEKTRLVNCVFSYYQSKLKSLTENGSYDKEKLFANCREFYKLVITESPNEISYRRNFVRVLELAKKYHEATSIQHEIYELSKSDLSELFKLAYLHDEKGNTEQAFLYYSKFINEKEALKTPESEAQYYAQKRIKEYHYSKNDLPQAKVEAEKQCKLPQHMLADEYDLAKICHEMKDAQSEILVLKNIAAIFEKVDVVKLQALNETDKEILSNIYGNLAKFYYRNEDIAEAIDHFTKSINLNTNDTMIHEILQCAENCLNADRTVDATKFVEIILNVHSHDQKALELQQNISKQEKTDTVLFIADVCAQTLFGYGQQFLHDPNTRKSARITIAAANLLHHFGMDMFFSYVRGKRFLENEEWVGRKGLVAGNKLLQVVLDMDELYDTYYGVRYFDKRTRAKLQIGLSMIEACKNGSILFASGKGLSTSEIYLQKGYAGICLLTNILQIYETVLKSQGRLLPTRREYHVAKQILGTLGTVGMVYDLYKRHPGVSQRCEDVLKGIKKKYDVQDDNIKTGIIIVFIGMVIYGAKKTYHYMKDSLKSSELSTILDNFDTCMRNFDMDGAIKCSEEYLQIEDNKRMREIKEKLLSVRYVDKQIKRFGMIPHALGATFASLMMESIENYWKPDMNRWHVAPMIPFRKHILPSKQTSPVLPRLIDPRLFAKKTLSTEKTSLAGNRRPLSDSKIMEQKMQMQSRSIDPKLFSKKLLQKISNVTSNNQRNGLK